MSAGILTRSLLQRDQTLFLSFIQGSSGQRFTDKMAEKSNQKYKKPEKDQRLKTDI